MKNNEIEQTNARRSFLKKAAYVVPTVIAISQITNPTSAEARKQGPASSTSYIGATAKSGPVSSQTTSTGGFSGGVFSDTGK